MTQVQKPHSLQGSEKFEAYPIHLSQQTAKVHAIHGLQSNGTGSQTRLAASSTWKLCCSVHRQPMSGVNSWTHQVGLSRTRPDKIVLIIQVFKVALCEDLGSSQELDFLPENTELGIIRTF